MSHEITNYNLRSGEFITYETPSGPRTVKVVDAFPDRVNIAVNDRSSANQETLHYADLMLAAPRFATAMEVAKFTGKPVPATATPSELTERLDRDQVAAVEGFQYEPETPIVTPEFMAKAAAIEFCNAVAPDGTKCEREFAHDRQHAGHFAQGGLCTWDDDEDEPAAAAAPDNLRLIWNKLTGILKELDQLVTVAVDLDIDPEQRMYITEGLRESTKTLTHIRRKVRDANEAADDRVEVMFECTECGVDFPSKESDPVCPKCTWRKDVVRV